MEALEDAALESAAPVQAAPEPEQAAPEPELAAPEPEQEEATLQEEIEEELTSVIE